MIDLWYKNAVVYELDVKTFQDSNGDGIGDFPGLTSRLPYIADLGATCIWLRPFFPSPWNDDGYDVADYYSIDPRLGTFGEFSEFLEHAQELGLRVIIDLVLNHTSIDHPWFQKSRSDPDSPYRDYYVWSREKPKKKLHEGVVFPGIQERVWEYDTTAEAWYHHRFFNHQPDLNNANPDVKREMGRIIGFWLRFGLSGFRVDAVHFMLEHGAGHGENALTTFLDLDANDKPDPYGLLRDLRWALSFRRGDAIFVGEASVPADHVRHYFGENGERMHVLFNFLMNQHLFQALARQDAGPLFEGVNLQREVPESGQWLNFLRNHDELDLSALTEDDKQEVYDAFAPDENMRVFERGIRRRLAPMFNGDIRRIELAYAVMLSLPGTPMIRSGDEIGMGDDLTLPERLAVRTPMQWSANPGAGFSDAPSDKLIRPIISAGSYGYERVNVAAQQCDPDSLLSRLRRLIRTRKACTEFGHCKFAPLDVGQRTVFAHRAEYRDGVVITLHNLGEQSVKLKVPVESARGEQLIDLFGDPASSVEPKLELPPYGYRWFRVVGSGSKRAKTDL